MSRNTNGPHAQQVEPITLGDVKALEPSAPCLHSRMVKDVVTREGKRNGKVKCLECGAKFDDPYSSR